jgi:hypothetical protein
LKEQEKDLMAMTMNVDLQESFNEIKFKDTLIKDKDFRINFITICISMTGCAFCFSLMNLIIPNLPGNIFFNSFLIGSFEIVAYSLSGLFIKILDLKRSINLLFLIALGSCIIYNSIQSKLFESVCLGLLMFCLAANANSISYAAYVSSPPELISTFFVIQSFFMTFACLSAPILAETALEYSFYIIMWTLFTCTIASLYIRIKEPEKR